MRKPIPIVLILEDDEQDLELFGLALSEINFDAQIFHVWDGEEGLSLLAELKKNTLPDLILLDINMPRFNGKEFFSLIQHDAELKTIPVAVISTSALQQDRDYFAAFNVPYIIKASDMQTFKTDLQNLFKNILG